MAIETIYVNLGTRQLHGGNNVNQGNSGSYDVALAVNLSTVTSKGAILEAVKHALSQLPTTVK